MPTYDYECDACGHTYELFQSITAKPIKKCPQCQRPKARRLIGTGAGIIFKGSGFYETDYRSDDYNNAAKAEKESTGDAKADKKDTSDTKSESSSDVKPSSEAKPATKKSKGKKGKSGDAKE